jgi:hypothetical protein
MFPNNDDGKVDPPFFIVKSLLLKEGFSILRVFLYVLRADCFFMKQKEIKILRS